MYMKKGKNGRKGLMNLILKQNQSADLKSFLDWLHNLIFVRIEFYFMWCPYKELWTRIDDLDITHERKPSSEIVLNK